MQNEKVELANRWKEDWSQLYQDILNCLRDHNSLDAVKGISEYNGLFDLRGINIKNIDFSQVEGSLRNVCFDYALLWNVNFSFLNLQNCTFNNASLRDCRFIKANLTGVSFQNAYLGSTNKLGAQLTYVQILNTTIKPEKYNEIYQSRNLIGITDFTRAKLENVDFRGAYFKSYSLFDFFQNYRIDDLEIFAPNGMTHAEEQFGGIRHTYDIFRMIKLKYQQIGCRREASSFYYLEMASSRRKMRWYNPRRFLEAIFADALCGYGEKPFRVLGWILMLVLIFTVLFSGDGVLINSNDKFIDALYYSVATFTPLGYGNLSLSEGYRIYEIIEVILGVILMPLFVVTLTRKIIPY